jgi:Enterobacter phage Enc34, ssDNA-binding protein
VFAPRSGPNGGKEGYSVTLVFEPGTDISALRASAHAAAREKWGDKVPKQLRSPFRSCSDREGQEGFTTGGTFITARSENKPGLVDQAMQPVLSNEVLYSGCYVRASLRSFAYDFQGNKGVSFALLNLQKMSDGERLDNRRSPDQDFEPLPGASDIFSGGEGKEGADNSDPFA